VVQDSDEDVDESGAGGCSDGGASDDGSALAPDGGGRRERSCSPPPHLRRQRRPSFAAREAQGAGAAPAAATKAPAQAADLTAQGALCCSVGQRPTTFDALSDKSKITVYGDAFTNVTQTNVAKMGKPGRSGCGAVNGARCTLLSYVPAEKPGEKVGERDLPSPGGGVRRRLLLQQPKLLRVKLDNPNLMRGQRIGTLDYVYGVIQAVVSTLCV